MDSLYNLDNNHKLCASNIRFEISGQEYKWYGGFGAILLSNERGLKKGDVRMIMDIPFYVFLIHGKEVSWTIPSQYCSAEWIRSFRKLVLGC